MIKEDIHTIVGNQLLTFAKTHGVPCMSGGTERRLLQYLMTYKPTNIIEIGSAIGYSTSFFSQHIATRGGRITSFEISHPSYMLAIYSLGRLQAYNARIYHANILTTPLDKIAGEVFDFVFVDGAKSEYAAYIERILPFCSPGCIFVCDDMLMYKEKVSSVYPLLEKYGYSYEIIPLDIDDGVLIFHTE